MPAEQQIADLQRVIADQARTIADLERQNRDLRKAIDALLQPAPSELLARNLTHPSRR
jgi:hypothetical protein